MCISCPAFHSYLISISPYAYNVLHYEPQICWLIPNSLLDSVSFSIILSFRSILPFQRTFLEYLSQDNLTPNHDAFYHIILLFCGFYFHLKFTLCTYLFITCLPPIFWRHFIFTTELPALWQCLKQRSFANDL